MGVPRQVEIYEAKTHFSKLVDVVARGETIIVARNNVPVLEMPPVGRPPDDVMARFDAVRERVRQENQGQSVLSPGETWRDLIGAGRKIDY